MCAQGQHADPIERMLGAGAGGYVLKDSEPAQLVAAIRVVAAGGTYVVPACLPPR